MNKNKIIKKTSNSVSSRFVDYQKTLIKRLKNRDYAIEYLNKAIEESLKGDEESQKLLLNALKNVKKAQGKVKKEDSYKKLKSFTSLIHSMGFNIRVY